MVSRGGRSKGCTNCRRRRVKCDETRPTCNRCKKRGLVCEGPKDLTWINHSNEFSASPISPEEGQQLVKCTTAVPAQISLAAFEEDMCLAYTRKILLRGGPVEVALNLAQSSNSPLDSAINPATELLRKAIVSLSVTFFGSRHSQDSITRKGYQQYGAVLRQFNAHLAQPELQVADETILTALTCMLLELFLPTGPDNFLKHVRGIEALMDVRGPPVESTGNTALIFNGLRVLSILGALADSRPSIYTRPEWRKLPSYHTDEPGLLRHEIFNVLADTSHLMSKREALSEEGVGMEDVRHQSLLADAESAFEQLKAIRPLWEQYNARQLAKLNLPSTEWTEIRIAEHTSATVYMLYSTAYVGILQLIDSLAPSEKNAAMRNAAAIEIVKCLELKEYEQREGAPESNTIGFVATKVAWQALGGFNSPEGQKLARVVKKTLNGISRTDSIGQAGLPEWQHIISRDMNGSEGLEKWATLSTMVPGRAVNGFPEIIDVGNKQKGVLHEDWMRFLERKSGSPRIENLE